MSITYQQAKRIRKTGLLSLFADQLMYEKKVTTAISKTISLKTRGRIMGLTQYLDPLNIAKMMTFGSALGPALLGHFMGRDPRDIQYFTGRLKPIREKSKTADKITKLSGQGAVSGEMTVVLHKMYKLMASTHEENVKRLEMNKSRQEEIELESERRHKELLTALGGLGGATLITTGQPKEEGDGFLGSLMKTLKDWAEKLITSLVSGALKAFEWLKDITAWGKNLLMGVDWVAFARALSNSAPALMFLAPYMMAAIEKEKIRQNPTAPEYKDNPYAMVLRGESKTEGQSAEINRRKSLKQIPRNQVDMAVKSKLDDNLLVQEFGADRKTLEEWLKSHTKSSDMWQAPVAKLAGTNLGAAEVGTKTATELTARQKIAEQSRTEFAKTDPRLISATPELSEKLNATVIENQDTKLNALAQKSSPTTEYNTSTVNTQTDKTIPIKRQIPPVRMQEPEFQRRILSNTVPVQ